MARIKLFALVLGALLSLAAASSTPTFCKCTCFKNSTIIPLSEDAGSSRRSVLIPSTDPDHLLSADRDALVFDVPAENDRHTTRLAKRVPAACSACTKTFCRSHGLPICTDAEDDDVTTMCFQRDSMTDRLIVWGFILGTLGLLGWAAVQKVRAVREARGGLGFGGAMGGGYSPLGQGRT